MIKLASLAAIFAMALGGTASAKADEAADRVAIHELLLAYGSTLDNRDFAGFSALFGADGVYVAGGGAEVKGPETGALMERILTESPRARRRPNFHLLFNEAITILGPDRARATSMGMFMVPAIGTGRIEVSSVARYEDELVKVNGRWLFARRKVVGISGPPAEPAEPVKP